MKQKTYGWYSEKQIALGRVNRVVWRDTNGKECILTEVTSSPFYTGNWDDIIPMGEMTEFVRQLESINDTNRYADIHYR